jgi:WD40 repeat protein
LFQRDGDRFVEKLKQLGITRVTRTNEPVSTIARKFDDSLDASLVAAEFGVPKDDFMKRLDAAQSVGRVLGTVKIPGGTIKREAFVEIYAQAVKDLKVGLVPARSKFLLGTINGDLTRTGLIKVSHRLDKPVHSITFAPDGVRLAYGQPNTLTFYDFNSEEIIDEVTGIKDYPVISCVSFSPDGRLVAIGGADGRIRIFNVDREGKLSKNVDLEGQAGVVLGMSFDRFSNRLVSCGSDRTLRWWNLADRKPLFLRRFDAPVYDCAFVNKDQAVVATDGKTLQFFEGTSGEQELSKLLDLPGNPLAVTFALEKGQMFITVGKQIYGFRLDNGDQFTSLTAKNVAHHLGVSPDGRWVVAPGNPMNRWDMRNETEHGSFYTKAIKHVVFSPDSLHYVLTDDLARRFSLWQIGNEK